MAKLTNNQRSPYTDVVRLTADDIKAIGNGGTRQIASIPAGGAVSLCAVTNTVDIAGSSTLVLNVGTTIGDPDEFIDALDVDAMTVGLDFTARDLQTQLKNKGLPWERAKGFDGSAVLGTWGPMPAKPMDHQIRLEKNGETVQSGNTRDFLTPLKDLVAFISTYFTLKKGDLIFTGTPAGVGPVKPGDVLEGFLNDDSRLRLNIR